MNQQPAALLIGPSLNTLTPAQLEEIARLIKPEMIDALDENEGEWNANEAAEDPSKSSLHPRYKFIFSNKDVDDEPGPERITFWEWTKSQSDLGEEADTHEWEIRLGEIIGPFGDSWEVLHVVRWFLEHGWTWATPISGGSAPKDPRFVLPQEPAPGLLMSMAVRFDHAIGLPGYYDDPMFASGEPAQRVSHQRRLESTLATMRQLYEEVSGYGFYSYVNKSRLPNQQAWSAASSLRPGYYWCRRGPSDDAPTIIKVTEIHGSLHIWEFEFPLIQSLEDYSSGWEFQPVFPTT